MQCDVVRRDGQAVTSPYTTTSTCNTNFRTTTSLSDRHRLGQRQIMPVSGCNEMRIHCMHARALHPLHGMLRHKIFRNWLLLYSTSTSADCYLWLSKNTAFRVRRLSDARNAALVLVAQSMEGPVDPHCGSWWICGNCDVPRLALLLLSCDGKWA